MSSKPNEQAPTLAVGALPAPSEARDLRALLQVVLEALNIPHAATVGDIEQHDSVLNDRVMHARIALKGVLECGDDPAWTTAYLRERLAERPPTGYRAGVRASE